MAIQFRPPFSSDRSSLVSLTRLSCTCHLARIHDSVKVLLSEERRLKGVEKKEARTKVETGWNDRSSLRNLYNLIKPNLSKEKERRIEFRSICSR